MPIQKQCLDCGERLSGRVDKLYCSEYCRSSFHYKKDQRKSDTVFKKIDRQLRLNRRVLLHFNRSGKSTIREEKLIDAGFDPAYFTHYWRNSKKQAYIFCYDMGYMKIKENGRSKYSLVVWQDYMSSAHTLLQV